MAADTCRDRHERRLAALKEERQPFEADWQQQNDFIAPGRMRLNERPERGGKNLMAKIVDESALLSFRIARSGMYSGMTSPSRPWFQWITSDPDLREYGPVKDYLFQAVSRGREVLQKSNVYNIMHNGYGDLLQFGQFAALIVNDDRDYMRGIPMLTGQYWLAQDHRYRVDTLYRRVWMTVQQMVGRFVAKPGGGMDWSTVSTTVKKLYDDGSYDQWVEVFHAVEPRHERDARKVDRQNKPILSDYWEVGNDKERMLEESGFDKSPILASRWDPMGEQVYSFCPGWEAVPAVKMLQAQQRMKGQGIEAKVRPPMVGPSALKNQPSSTLPGSITYVDFAGNGQSPYRAAVEVNLSIQELAADIDTVTHRIDRMFYADLFMAITQMEGVQPRNIPEIQQRKEEQLLQLGPVIERQHNESLNTLVDILFDKLTENDLLPPPPEEIQGENLKADYISALAQAQKAVATGAVERLFAFAGNLAGAKADVLDKLDFDQSIDEYADMIGAPPALVRSDDKVAEMRATREKAMAAAQNAEMAAKVMPAVKQGADAARVLSEADANGGASSLLSNLGIAG